MRRQLAALLGFATLGLGAVACGYSTTDVPEKPAPTVSVNAGDDSDGFSVQFVQGHMCIVYSYNTYGGGRIRIAKSISCGF